MASAAEFELMRFQILSASLRTELKKRIEIGTIFAWNYKVFPLFSRNLTAKPFEEHFNVRESEIERLSIYYDECWRNQTVVTYYEVENKFCNSGMDRWKLISASQYMFVNNMFKGGRFWENLLQPTQYPIEARGITEEWSLNEIYFS